MARDEREEGEASGLSRWARLKAEAGQASPPPAPAPVAVPEPTEEEVAAIVARLPPLDSIGESRDVTAFLARGVPQALRSAALDRLWRVDPAIRDRIPDAIDYAENYHLPESIAGWGAAPPGAGEKLAERLHAAAGELTSIPEEAPTTSTEPAVAPPAAVSRTAPDAPADLGALAPLAATSDPRPARRRRGSALPREEVEFSARSGICDSDAT
jgi:hypothetical protein